MVNEQKHVNIPNKKNVQRLFTSIAILMILIGQIFVYVTPLDSLNPFPPALWIDIAGILLLILSQIQRLSSRFPHWQISNSALWVLGSLIFSWLAVLTMLLFEEYKRTNYIPVTTFWLFAIFCYLSAFFDEVPSLSKCLAWLKRRRYELAWLGLAILLGAILRFYKLGEIPQVVNGDEGRVGMTALSTNNFAYVNPFSLWENFGALYLQSIGFVLKIFGISPFALRLPAAVGGVLAIPALYLFSRQISGRGRIALIAAFLLAISHTHIHFSRTVAVAYIQGNWLIPLELYFLLTSLTKRSSWRAATGGILLTIHFITYLDAQIITAMIAAYMLIASVFLRSWFKPALRQAAVFWGGFGITILPEIFYVQLYPDSFFNRLNQDGIFHSGWLERTLASGHENTVQLLAERVAHAFLSLIYYPATDFYGSSVPMLSLISATLFLLGLSIAFLQTRSPRMLLLNGYFWAGTLSIGIFAIPPSADTYRMLIVLPAALLLAAIGLNHGLDATGVGWVSMRKTYLFTTTLILTGLLVFNVWAYFLQFAGLCLYGTDYPTRFASYLGNYLRTVDRKTQTYLLSDINYIFGTHLSVYFLSGKGDNYFVSNISDSVDVLEVRPDEIIIANPDRIDELRAWADNHPGGKLQYQYDCGERILLTYQFP